MENIHHTSYCPTCGKPSEIFYSPEWLLTHFSGIVGNILAFLLQRRREKRAASLRELCEAAYVGVKKGPPVDAPNTVKVLLTQNRAKLHSYGWTIAGPSVTGSGYYLVPLEYQ